MNKNNMNPSSRNYSVKMFRYNSYAFGMSFLEQILFNFDVCVYSVWPASKQSKWKATTRKFGYLRIMSQNIEILMFWLNIRVGHLLFWRGFYQFKTEHFNINQFASTQIIQINYVQHKCIRVVISIRLRPRMSYIVADSYHCRTRFWEMCSLCFRPPQIDCVNYLAFRLSMQICKLN